MCTLPLTDQCRLSSPKRKEYFMFDPAFPERLKVAGYNRLLEFIQDMFREYAQAGLTKRSDKEFAISGLLQRMKDAIRSECVHGTFRCFLSRLLLWRVSDTITDNEEAYSGDTEHQLPSWSWMSHDHIEFFSQEKMIDVPEEANYFDSKFKNQLHVRIFELRDCYMEEQGERHVLVRDDAQFIGEYWLDTHKKTQIQGCVVVGKTEDHWFVLLVTEVSRTQYRRFGVGRIKPYYISETSSIGVLV